MGPCGTRARGSCRNLLGEKKRKVRMMILVVVILPVEETGEGGEVIRGEKTD